MSIWGPDPFDNDDGADWFADLMNEPSLDLIRKAIEEISDPSHIGYLEVIDGAEAVAAAEVLAELLGSPGEDPVLGEELEELTKALKKELMRESKRGVNKLIKQAVDALEIILNDTENSELRQMWEGQEDEMPAWSLAITTLQQRLQKIVVP